MDPATLPVVELQPQPAAHVPTKKSRRVATRFQVKSACSNCKRRHAGCDYGRPCGRCVKTNKADSCRDVIDLRTKKAKEALGLLPSSALIGALLPLLLLLPPSDPRDPEN